MWKLRGKEKSLALQRTEPRFLGLTAGNLLFIPLKVSGSS
jgi:hypothetical protein